MITVAEYISNYVSAQGIKQCFMVPGGGAMFLNEAFRKNKNISVLPMHHEQACTMAGEGFTKLTNVPTLISVTTGPGAINALNGVYGAFTDSIPMFIVSGQVKRETYGPLHHKNLRQLGDQEVNIVSMVNNITKYAKTITDINELDKILEDSFEYMVSGRKGPVWIDVPIDIQSSLVKDKPIKQIVPNTKFDNIDESLDKLEKLLKVSKKPVIIAGSGIRLSDSSKEFLIFAEKFNIPITTTFNSHDVVNSDHKLYIGRQGTIGDRAGNFAVENSDLLIILGSRLNIRQIGYNFNSFSPHSKKIMVDIDKEELNKKTLKIDVKINTDLKFFFNQANKINTTNLNLNYTKFISICKNLQKKYPVIKTAFYKSKKINPYILMSIIHEFSENNDTFVTSDGSAAVMSSQALKIKNNQRLYSNSGSASMGYGLPAAIGASIGSKNRVICIEGDGSIQMNIQELETVKYNNLNLKIIIIENGGYLSIKQTQKRFFNKEIATGPKSGLGFPQLKKVCKAYGISCSETSTIKSTKDSFKKHYYKNYPHIFIVSVDKNQGFEPKPSSKRLPNGRLISTGLDDMAPHLSNIEMKKIKTLFNF